MKITLAARFAVLSLGIGAIASAQHPPSTPNTEPGQAAAQDREKTLGLDNGRHWNAILDVNWRIGYLDGLIDGWKLRAYTEESIRGRVINAMTSSGSFTTNEVAKMVTAAYSNTENLNLPVGWIALACLAVQRGETTTEAVFLALRQFLTGLQSKPEYSADELDPLPAILASRPKTPIAQPKPN
jgi:hypothetical protein